MKRKWIIIILICALLAAALLAGLSLQKDESPWKENTAGGAIGVELSQIDHMLVSNHIYYLDDWDNPVWATVTDPTKIEEIYTVISQKEVEVADPAEGVPEGGGPRFVTYVLNDGSQVELRFVDDLQLWLDDNTVYSLSKPYDLQSKIEEILLGETEELINTDIIRMFFYNSVRYRASGDFQMDWPEGYTLLGHTDTREENWGENFSANFMGEIFQKGDSFYAKEDGELTYVKFVPDPMQNAVDYSGNAISFDIEAVSSLEIFASLSGRDIIITDMLIIERILENVNGMSFEMSDNQDAVPENSYLLIFWDSMDQEVVSFSITDQEGRRIIYDTHYYDLSGEGGIDVAYISGLVEEE